MSKVNHPVHYNKYIARAGKKNKDTKLEDLQKAAWYLAREIERLKQLKKQYGETIEGGACD